MTTEKHTRSYDWLVLMVASVLLILRLLLQLAAVRPEAPSAPVGILSLAFDVIITAVLAFGLFNLTSLLKGREQYRLVTIIVLSAGLVSALGLLFLPG